MKRRDFVNGVLRGSGIALLTSKAPLYADNLNNVSNKSTTEHNKKDKYDEWNGPGGVGDYAKSNGNTRGMVDSAHSVRDKQTPDEIHNKNEEYDLVIIGAGFSGLSSAYFYHKYSGENKKILVLDLDSLPGGVAKLNEFIVDGHRIMAPQASDVFWKPTGLAQQLNLVNEIWYDMGLPNTPEELDRVFVRLNNNNEDDELKYCANHFSCTYGRPQDATTGYFFRSSDNKYSMYKNIIENNFDNAPLSERIKSQLVDAYDRSSPLPYDGEDWKEWLDSMTLKNYLEKELGYDPYITEWISNILAPIGGGLGADVVSAYHAYLHAVPGVRRFNAQKVGRTREAFNAGYLPVSFPGGNSLIARHIFKHLVPKGINGGYSMDDILLNRFNFNEFDKAENNIRFRMSSMVSAIRHDGNPNIAKRVFVDYIHDGVKYRISGKRVICASGGWINKHILKDAPVSLIDAFSSYTHAPMMCVNVALRNTRFMINKGITAAYYDKGFGYYFALRPPLKIGRYTEPTSIDGPAVLTIYISFEKYGSGLSFREQARLARYELLAMSYRDIERKIITQLHELFGDSGFDADKDVAEIVVNRQGHDYNVAPPYHFFGVDGKKGVPSIIREGYGRVRFAHSELNGIQLWTNACDEGARAAIQSLSAY